MTAARVMKFAEDADMLRYQLGEEMHIRG